MRPYIAFKDNPGEAPRRELEKVKSRIFAIYFKNIENFKSVLEQKKDWGWFSYIEQLIKKTEDRLKDYISTLEKEIEAKVEKVSQMTLQEVQTEMHAMDKFVYYMHYFI